MRLDQQPRSVSSCMCVHEGRDSSRGAPPSNSIRTPTLQETATCQLQLVEADVLLRLGKLTDPLVTHPGHPRTRDTAPSSVSESGPSCADASGLPGQMEPRSCLARCSILRRGVYSHTAATLRRTTQPSSWDRTGPKKIRSPPSREPAGQFWKYQTLPTGPGRQRMGRMAAGGCLA